MKARSFSGGLTLPPTTRSGPPSLETISPPETLYLPLKQHLGPSCRQLVKKDALVRRGQSLGESSETSVQSPIDGQITHVDKNFRHMDGSNTVCLTVTASSEAETAPEPDTYQENMAKILHSGVIDSGPEPLPLLRKIVRAQKRQVRHLIINSLDEFFIFGSRASLLTHYPREAVEGIRLLQRLLRPEQTTLAVYEKVLPHIRESEELSAHADIVPLVAKHPQHKDPLLISALTGEEYPMESTPLDMGVVPLSLETAVILARVVLSGQPNTEKPLTLHGPEPGDQRNVIVPLGTPISHLLQQLNLDSHSVAKVIAGGPLTGTALSSLEYPVTKEMDQIHLQKAEHQVGFSDEVCVKCGFCVEVCPMRLMPFLLSGFSSTGHFGMAAENDIFSCIECGCCAYVCPVNIPMVQWIQVGKSRLSSNLRSEAV